MSTPVTPDTALKLALRANDLKQVDAHIFEVNDGLQPGTFVVSKYGVAALAKRRYAMSAGWYIYRLE